MTKTASNHKSYFLDCCVGKVGLFDIWAVGYLAVLVAWPWSALLFVWPCWLVGVVDLLVSLVPGDVGSPASWLTNGLAMLASLVRWPGWRGDMVRELVLLLSWHRWLVDIVGWLELLVGWHRWLVSIVR